MDYTKYIPNALQGKRLDVALATLFPQFSRSRLQQFIQQGRVLLNQQVMVNQRYKINANDFLLLNTDHLSDETHHLPQNIALNIVFEDDFILVIDKPAGLTVHPGNGQKDGTLLNALLFYNADLAKIPRAGIVHRLDKNTSGLMVVAKNLQAQNHLVAQLQNRTVKRHYWAIIHGQLKKNLKIDAPIGRHPKQRTKMAVVPEHLGGKQAMTHVQVLKNFQQHTLVLCQLQTGRTHQIRVHMAHLGHSLVGDNVYEPKNQRTIDFPRQALHAVHLALIHPHTKSELFWQSPLPEDFQKLLTFDL